MRLPNGDVIKVARNADKLTTDYVGKSFRSKENELCKVLKVVNKAKKGKKAIFVVYYCFSHEFGTNIYMYYNRNSGRTYPKLKKGVEPETFRSITFEDFMAAMSKETSSESMEEDLLDDTEAVL